MRGLSEYLPYGRSGTLHKVPKVPYVSNKVSLL